MFVDFLIKNVKIVRELNFTLAEKLLPKMEEVKNLKYNRLFSHYHLPSWHFLFSLHGSPLNYHNLCRKFPLSPLTMNMGEFFIFFIKSFKLMKMPVLCERNKIK